MSLHDENIVLHSEARFLWKLSRELSDIKTRYCRSGTGCDELRDELDLLAEMTTCQAVARQARAMIADIDTRWPRAKSA
jgi:hypothetical protein